MTAKTPGQLNFEAYDRAHGVRSPATWNHLGETERAGFDDGAQAVLNDAFPGLRKQLGDATAERDDYAARLKAVNQSWAKLAAQLDDLREAHEQQRLQLLQAQGEQAETAAELTRVKQLHAALLGEIQPNGGGYTLRTTGVRLDGRPS